ncbi:MAG: hypothetical protein RBT63_09815 [Bdellovibrionales bacterium]|jgi:hypothetical protein|nr:hypothetical protein [Bdellovibrionales bacterium]
MKEPSRLRTWLLHKWETAENWLPWFLGIASVLVVVTGLAVNFIRSQTDRKPAGFVLFTDSSQPSETSRSSAGSEPKHHSGKAPGPQARGSGAFVIALRDTPSTKEIEDRTGIRAARARAVVLSTHSLSRQPGQESNLPLELFPGVQPVFHLKVLSGYEVNEGMHSGFASDDPNSRIQLTTKDGMVSGFILYQGTEFRIVSDPERGVHYIIQVKRP